MGSSMKRLMLESEIPSFVDEIIKTGCDICAVGHDRYLIGDADLSVDDLKSVLPELRRIKEIYGERDFLRLEIVAYLRSLGRYLDPGSPAIHWSENLNQT